MTKTPKTTARPARPDCRDDLRTALRRVKAMRRVVEKARELAASVRARDKGLMRLGLLRVVAAVQRLEEVE